MLLILFKILIVVVLYFSKCVQNYLKEAWNIFDFVTVLGSITDILVTEIEVSHQRDTSKCLRTKILRYLNKIILNLNTYMINVMNNITFCSGCFR